MWLVAHGAGALSASEDSSRLVAERMGHSPLEQEGCALPLSKRQRPRTAPVSAVPRLLTPLAAVLTAPRPTLWRPSQSSGPRPWQPPRLPPACARSPPPSPCPGASLGPAGDRLLLLPGALNQRGSWGRLLLPRVSKSPGRGRMRAGFLFWKIDSCEATTRT